MRRPVEPADSPSDAVAVVDGTWSSLPPRAVVECRIERPFEAS